MKIIPKSFSILEYFEITEKKLAGGPSISVWRLHISMSSWVSSRISPLMDGWMEFLDV